MRLIAAAAERGSTSVERSSPASREVVGVQMVSGSDSSPQLSRPRTVELADPDRASGEQEEQVGYGSGDFWAAAGRPGVVVAVSRNPASGKDRKTFALPRPW